MGHLSYPCLEWTIEAPGSYYQLFSSFGNIYETEIHLFSKVAWRIRAEDRALSVTEAITHHFEVDGNDVTAHGYCADNPITRGILDTLHTQNIESGMTDPDWYLADLFVCLDQLWD
jgi:hypothetical protein